MKQNEIRCANAFYFSYINKIGGIESHFNYIAKKYKCYDIVIFYDNGDNEQLNRLRKQVKCVQVKEDTKIVCDKIFCCFNRAILDKVEAKERYLVLHGDYMTMYKLGHISKENLPIDKRINKYYGVSQVACDGWKELTGIEAENIYEPVVLDNVRKPIRMIMASRLTREKGTSVIDPFAKAMDDAGINWFMDVYTDWKEYKPKSKNVRILKPRIDIANLYGAYDIACQFSLTEGYGLSPVEALKRGTPLIVTPCPAFKEIGINEENSVEVPFDMSKVDVDAIVKLASKRVKYKEPEDKWEEVLEKKKATYKPIIVKATDEWEKRDITSKEDGHRPEPGEEMILSEERLNEILEASKRLGIKLIEQKGEKND